MFSFRKLAIIFLTGLTIAMNIDCTTGECSEAPEYAESCGVTNLELEDDVVGCNDQFKCRSQCVLDADCDEIVQTFGEEKDYGTALWQCYLACQNFEE